jgi:hypothetical protein
VDKQIAGEWKMITKASVSLGIGQFAYWKNI